MATTMNLIARQTVGAGGAASVTFSNIPQTYTDLKVVMSTRNSRSDGTVFATVQFSFNGVTTNRSRRNLYNVSGTVGSDSGSDIISISTSSSATASTFDNMEVYIPNYTSSNNKSMSIDSTTENNGTAVYQILSAGLWSSSSAINQITITPTSYNWTEFSTFYLYGISNNTTTQNTTVPYASGGDAIVQVGGYWYHAFTNSGTFTPLKSLNADILVVGAGGGGGKIYGGGGGGGAIEGASFFQTQTLSTSNCTVTIGAGGAGSTNGAVKGGTGGSSSFAGTTTITALGGGGGGSNNTLNGANGGSGGGTGWGSGTTAGSASGNNTNAGATGTQNYATQGARGGGGGGATSAGVSGITSGNGGQGRTLTTIDSNLTATNFALFSGMTVISSGGGAGTEQNTAGLPGTGGTGAGNGGRTDAPSFSDGGNATSFGSGGGGGNNGGNGFRGLVIVRYAV